ncbi:MAG: hypothetical protein PHY02_07430 [Phycisphaerae bacterium]|nr:hypothetical protein [Phycisphaerae bacterium]
MFEIARELEQTAVWFRPAVLIVPGLVAVLVGLFVWLGGLGFRKVLAGIIGAISGGVCGFFISGRNMPPTIVSAGITAFIAIVFEKIFIAILAGVLAAVLGFAVLARPYIGNEDSLNEYGTEDRTMFLDTQESIEAAKRYIADFAAETRQIFSKMPIYKHAITAAIVIVFIAAGFFQKRLTSAFCCSALGTMLIFTGMILLLLYKGAAPISSIFRSQLFYTGVFGAMTAFGMAEQLLLCQRINAKLTGHKQKNRNRKKPEEISPSWRNK